MNLMTTHSQQLREFVQQVQKRANLDNYEEAHQLARATLTVLGQSISGGEAQRLAEWLPPELHDELAEQSGQASGFNKRNFVEKVGGMIHTVDEEKVETQASAVLHAVRTAATGGELEDTIAQLPGELAEMFR